MKNKKTTLRIELLKEFPNSDFVRIENFRNRLSFNFKQKVNK